MIDTTFAIRDKKTSSLLSLDIENTYILSLNGVLGIWETNKLEEAIAVVGNFITPNDLSLPYLEFSEDYEIVAIHRVNNYQYITNKGFITDIFELVGNYENFVKLQYMNEHGVIKSCFSDAVSKHLNNLKSFDKDYSFDSEELFKVWYTLSRMGRIPTVEIDVESIIESMKSDFSKVSKLRKNNQFFAYSVESLSIPEWANSLCFNKETKRYCFAYYNGKKKFTGMKFSDDHFQYELDHNWVIKNTSCNNFGLKRYIEKLIRKNNNEKSLIATHII